jgi:carbonic anhydrase
VRALELECVKVSIANLRTFPCVPEREAAGKLRLRGAYFAIADGILHLLDEDSGTFAPA